VDLRLQNASPRRVLGVSLAAELLGTVVRREAGDLAAGEQHAASLRFSPGPPRPGLHALALRISFRPEEPKDAPPRFERECLLLPLGERPEPALEVRTGELTLDVEGELPVTLRSLDGGAHDARLSVLAPQGINVLEPPERVAVPAAGAAEAKVRLIRGAATRGALHRILVVAAPADGPLERATLAEGHVKVEPDPALLPRMRLPLAAAGALLLIGAAAYELLAARARGRNEAAGGD
jgi:hypothetical protein